MRYLTAAIHRIWRAPDGSWNRFGIASACAIGAVSALISLLALLQGGPADSRAASEPDAKAGPVASAIPSSSWPTALDNCRGDSKRSTPASPGASFAVCFAARGFDKPTWSDEIAIEPNDSVELIVGYANVGTRQQDNVVVSVTLPSTIALLPRSSILYTSKSLGGDKISDHIVDRGVNIGSYAPGANAYVKFTILANGGQSFACGINTVAFRAKVETDDGARSDEVVIRVNPRCP